MMALWRKTTSEFEVIMCEDVLSDIGSCLSEYCNIFCESGFIYLLGKSSLQDNSRTWSECQIMGIRGLLSSQLSQFSL